MLSRTAYGEHSQGGKCSMRLFFLASACAFYGVCFGISIICAYKSDKERREKEDDSKR